MNRVTGETEIRIFSTIHLSRRVEIWLWPQIESLVNRLRILERYLLDIKPNKFMNSNFLIFATSWLISASSLLVFFSWKFVLSTPETCQSNTKKFQGIDQKVFSQKVVGFSFFVKVQILCIQSL